MAMKSIEISLGHAAWHSPWFVQLPKNSSMVSTMFSVRLHRSAWPWGNRFRCWILAAVNRLAALFGHAATHAPQPMQAAASIAASAASFGTGVMFASGAEPVGIEMYPPDSMMRSKAARLTDRSLMMGKPAARHGSITMWSPSVNLRMCS